jgi:hypothetical protein
MTNNWQTLDTAPKDGTHILFYYEGSVYTAWYEESEEFSFVDNKGERHSRYSYWHIDSPCNNCWYDICDPNPVNSLWQPIIYPHRCEL